VRKALYLLSLAVLLGLAANTFAQNREKFVISAKAGGINAVSGQASIHAKGQSEWQQLMITDDLEAGDRVKTASDGRVEILLNPGTYLRVGGNSEVELSNNSLDNLQVRLLRGIAIVEATGADGLELNIGISTPHTKLAIVRHGLYRLNVIPEDATELIVRKGRVLLNDSTTKVKGGNKVIFSATSVSVAKLSSEEKKNKDDVEVWSKDRAETLARANRRITDRMLSSAFASWNGFGRFGFRSSGFWFYNSSSRCYTFLPFGFGWGSPYGSDYTRSIYFPSRRYYPGHSPSYPSGGSGSSTSSGSSGSSGSGYPSSPAPTRSTPISPAQSSPRISSPMPRDDRTGRTSPRMP
jgi:FecR protein